MKKIFRDRYLVFIIILVGVLVRLLYFSVPIIINKADGAGYVAMGDLVLKGNWRSFLDDYTYRTPGYPFFIALIKIIFGKYFNYGLPLVQHLLGVITAVLIYFIGKKVFNKKVGFFAGLLTALNAFQIYWEHNTMSDFFFAFMTVITFYLFLVALQSNKKRGFILFGIFYGLNLLTRPIFQLFFLLFPFILYCFNKNIKKVVVSFLLIMVPTVIIVAPWIYQNWVRHQCFCFTPFLGVQLMVRTQNFIDMNSPLQAKAKAAYYKRMKEMNFDQVAVSGWCQVQLDLGYKPWEADKALREIGIEALKRNPLRYFRETITEGKKFLTTHSTINLYGDQDIEESFRLKFLSLFNSGDKWINFQQKINWKLTPKPFIFFILAAVGIIFSIFKFNNKAIPFVLVTLYLFFLTIALEEGGMSRYRVPLDPFLFLFASYAPVFIVEHLINKKARKTLVIIPVLLLFWIALNLVNLLLLSYSMKFLEKYIKSNLPENSSILLVAFDEKKGFPSGEARQKYRFFDYGPQLAKQPLELLPLSYDYVIFYEGEKKRSSLTVPVASWTENLQRQDDITAFKTPFYLQAKILKLSSLRNDNFVVFTNIEDIGDRLEGNFYFFKGSGGKKTNFVYNTDFVLATPTSWQDPGDSFKESALSEKYWFAVKYNNLKVELDPPMKESVLVQEIEEHLIDTLNLSGRPVSKFLGLDGSDYCGLGDVRPNKAVDIHIRLSRVKKKITGAFIVAKDEKVRLWHFPENGINSPIIIKGEGGILDMYFDPFYSTIEGKNYKLFLFFEDGSYSLFDFQG